MTHRAGLTVLALAAAAAATISAAGAAPLPEAGGNRTRREPPVQAERTDWRDRVLEMQAHRRSAVISAWLSNGLRVHHRRMTEQPGMVEVVVCFAGGELLECGQTRGLTLLSACFLDAPGAEGQAATEIARTLAECGLRIEGGVAPDGLVMRIWGAAADIEAGLAASAAVFASPRADEESVARAADQAREVVARSRNNERVVVADPLREMLCGMAECRAQPACVNKMGRFEAKDVESWIRRHGLESSGEVAVVGDIDLESALRLVASTLGGLPERGRASHKCLSADRKVPRPQGPLIGETRCDAGAPVEQAHVMAGFLSPNQCEVLEVRRLRAGARVLAERLEAKLHGLELGGEARVGAQYLPSPFDGLSVTVITARVEPTHAAAVRQVMQDSMCQLLDGGLAAAELARATESLAQWVSASERDPRYWSMLLSRSTMTGLEPDELVDGAAMYRSMKPSDVIDAMRRACTPENRVGLMVLPAE